MAEYIEDYSWDTEIEVNHNKVYVLIIYDISDTKMRTKLAKHLSGYGFRVQKSAFEALLPKNKYRKLLDELPRFVTKDDSIKVYKMVGSGQVTSFGRNEEIQAEDVILI